MATTDIVCFSGGESSALVAVEVFRRNGNDRLVLLNHDINPDKEHPDIKRFKLEVAAYCGVPVTYANYGGIVDPDDLPDQFDVCILARAFKTRNNPAICTSRLKTRPFFDYLERHHPDKDCVIYYGFDEDEPERIARRRSILGPMGYESRYPLAEWGPTLSSIEEIGIKRPLTYALFKHANCVGCLKAGLQHWYVVYCTRPDVYAKAKASEELIGHTIHAEGSLEGLEDLFGRMRRSGVEPTEHLSHQKFWSRVRKVIDVPLLPTIEYLPCECIT